jgi:hypothetical protein
MSNLVRNFLRIVCRCKSRINGMDKKDKPQRRAKQQQETAEKKLTTPAKKPTAAGAKRINFDPAMMPNLPGGRDKLVPRLRSRKRQLRPDHQALRQRKLSDYNSRMEDWNGTTVSKRVGTKPRYEESKRSLHCYCHNNNQPDDGSCPRCISDAKAGRPVNHETCDICDCNCGIGYAASDHPRIASEKQMMAANTTMSVAVVVSACVMDTMGTVGMVGAAGSGASTALKYMEDTEEFQRFVIEYFKQVQQNATAYGKGYDHSAAIKSEFLSIQDVGTPHRLKLQQILGAPTTKRRCGCPWPQLPFFDGLSRSQQPPPQPC